MPSEEEQKTRLVQRAARVACSAPIFAWQPSLFGTNITPTPMSPIVTAFGIPSLQVLVDSLCSGQVLRGGLGMTRVVFRVEIDRRGLDGGMAQVLLDEADVVARIGLVGGRGMAQPMGGGATQPRRPGHPDSYETVFHIAYRRWQRCRKQVNLSGFGSTLSVR